jgi:hypothetical protein
MPFGMDQAIRGTVRDTSGWLVIETGCGDLWRLMGIWRSNRYLGKIVTVKSKREGFDVHISANII